MSEPAAPVLDVLLRELRGAPVSLPPPPPGVPWERALERALASADREVRWRIGPAAEVAAEAEPGLPAVTRAASAWWVVGLDGARARRVDDAGNVALADPAALGSEAHAWAQIEPSLPMSVLADRSSAWSRVFALLREEAPDLRALAVYAAAAGLLGLVTPLMVQVLVNSVAFGATGQPLSLLVVMLLVGLGVGGALRVLERYVVEMMQRRLFVRTVADLAARLPRIRDEVHQRMAPTEVVNRLFDVLTAQKSLAALLLDGLDAALQTAAGLLLLALYHPALLGFDVLLLGALALVLFLPGRRATKTAIGESKAKHAIAGWLEEVAAHPELFRAHDGSALQRADALAHAWLGERRSHFRVFLAQYGASLALQVLASTALLGLGGALVMERQLSLGQLVAAELVVTTVLLSFSKLADKLESAYDLVAAVDKIGQVAELPRIDVGGWELAPAARAASLALDGLVVEDGGPALHLRVGPGESIALLCADDRVAWALARALTGAAEARSGAARVDDVGVDDLSLRALRGAVALLRGADLVSGTVGDNLSLGVDAPEVGALRRALDRVGLDARALPRGLATELGPSGAPLGAVDRARVAVARASLGPQRLVVVDRMLDALPAELAGRMLRALADDGARTVVILTGVPAIAALASRQLHLDDRGISPAGGPR